MLAIKIYSLKYAFAYDVDRPEVTLHCPENGNIQLLLLLEEPVESVSNLALCIPTVPF